MIGAGVMVAIRWHDVEWVQMHAPGGMIYNWTAENTILMADTARRMAPQRSGRLKRSVRADNRQGGPHSIRSYIRAGGPLAPHARYVLEGTEGPIFARDWVDADGTVRPGFLALKPHPAGGYPNTVFREAVRGQTANNFIDRAVGVHIRAISAGARSR